MGLTIGVDIGGTKIAAGVVDEEGNILSTYKVPDIYSVPKEIGILPLETNRENLAVLNSKAVGEPPLMYGIGAYFAIRNAVKAFTDCSPTFDAPFTPEKVLMNLYRP